MHRLALLLSLSAAPAIIRAEPQDSPAVVSLIDAHGITVTAAVPAADAARLNVALVLTPRARNTLIEGGRGRPDHADLYRKLGDADGRRVTETVGRLWRWYDFLCHGRDYPAEELDLPDLTEYWTSYYFASYRNYRAEDGNGYSIDLRKPDYGGWFYDGSRTFDGERARITVNLKFSEDDPGGRGAVLVDGETLFECRPGADTFEGEFSRRCYRSRLWETLAARDFRLARDRLRMLLGSRYDRLIGMLRTHQNWLRSSSFSFPVHTPGRRPCRRSK